MQIWSNIALCRIVHGHVYITEVHTCSAYINIYAYIYIYVRIILICICVHVDYNYNIYIYMCIQYACAHTPPCVSFQQTWNQYSPHEQCSDPLLSLYTGWLAGFSSSWIVIIRNIQCSISMYWIVITNQPAFINYIISISVRTPSYCWWLTHVKTWYKPFKYLLNSRHFRHKKLWMVATMKGFPWDSYETHGHSF